ncbi:AAA family ATPase [Streptomyces sp. NPDC003688]
MTTAAHRYGELPPWSPDDLAAIHRLQALGRSVGHHFVGRRLALDLLEVAVIAREHVLLLGPPGTGKTDLVTRFAAGLGTRPFVRLLTRFTEPSEVFGPVDVAAFRDGRHAIRTEGMLPEALIAFLDEIFQCGSPILNTLLTVMNERVFHHGRETQPVPLISLIGASNTLPQDPALVAFADRFLLRVNVSPVADSHLEELLEKSFAPHPAEGAGHTWVDHESLERLGRQVDRVDLNRVTAVYRSLIRELLAQGVVLSDRRIVRGLRLVAAAAMRRESVRAEPRDLWPLRHIWTDPAHEQLVQESVQRVVEADGGPSASTTLRAAHHIVGEARLMSRQVSAGASDAAVENVLRGLNKLRLELESVEPANLTARDELTTIIDNTLALLRV